MKHKGIVVCIALAVMMLGAIYLASQIPPTTTGQPKPNHDFYKCDVETDANASGGYMEVTITLEVGLDATVNFESNMTIQAFWKNGTSTSSPAITSIAITDTTFFKKSATQNATFYQAKTRVTNVLTHPTEFDVGLTWSDSRVLDSITFNGNIHEGPYSAGSHSFLFTATL